MAEFDFSHVFQFPPQPSTVTGVGTLIMGIMALALGQIELGGPAIVAGLVMIGTPDSSTTHTRDLEGLHENVAQMRYETRLAAQAARAKPTAPVEGDVPVVAATGDDAP